MAVSTGFNAYLYLITGGTCTTTNDKLSLTGGTCTLVGYLDSYSKNTSLETIDTTSFGDRVRKVIPGFPGANVSLSGTYNYSDASQAALWTDIEAVTHTEKVLKVKESGSNTIMKGYFTAVNSGSSVGSKSSFAAEYTSNTIPNTTA
jgi:hypothetical protein